MIATTAPKRLLTFIEFCEETGVRTTTGRKLIATGMLPVVRVGRRVLIARDTVDRFVRGELTQADNTNGESR